MMLLRQGESAFKITMRKIHLLPFLCVTLFPCGARAQTDVQNMDIFFLFGASHVNSQTIGGSAVTLSSATDLSVSYGYGYQILRKSAASLWVEFAPAFGGVDPVKGSIGGGADLSWKVFDSGLRFMIPVQSRISVYGVAGAGPGFFQETVIKGGANPSLGSTSTVHGVFDFGGGVDFRLTRRLSIRGEFRDYVTGAGLSGVAGRHHPLAFGGVAFHF